jgi:hypothetical protein
VTVPFRARPLPPPDPTPATPPAYPPEPAGTAGTPIVGVAAPELR